MSVIHPTQDERLENCDGPRIYESILSFLLGVSKGTVTVPNNSFNQLIKDEKSAANKT